MVVFFIPDRGRMMCVAVTTSSTAASTDVADMKATSECLRDVSLPEHVNHVTLPRDPAPRIKLTSRQTSRGDLP